VLVLWHLLRVVAGYVLATVAAALVLAARPEPWASAGVTGDLAPFLGEAGSHLVIGLVGLMAAGFPTIGFIFIFAVAIIASEAWSLRSVTIWIVIGGLAGAGLAVPVGLAPGPEAESATVLPMFAAGFAAGIVYWLLAGRRAGAWRRAVPPAA
jgi:hypothetical protein